MALGVVFFDVDGTLVPHTTSPFFAEVGYAIAFNATPAARAAAQAAVDSTDLRAVLPLLENWCHNAGRHPV